jgi:hypothetical protein
MKWAGIAFTARPEALYVKDQQEQNVLTSVRIENLALYLPMGKGNAVALDLRQLTDARFKAYQETILFEESYTRSISRSGGLNMASVSVAQALWSSLFVGVRAGYVFGRIAQAWSGDFDNTDLRDIEIYSNIENTGSLFSAGLAVKFGGGLSAGAVYTPAYDVEQKERRSSSFALMATEQRTLAYPPQFGFGMSYRHGEKLLGQADVLITRWSDFEIDGQTASGYKDVVRVALGGEYRASRNASGSYFSRIPLRLGYAFEPWYLKTADGKDITGHFVTLGIGLPFGRQGAKLDASLEIGLRGDVSSIGAEEKIVRGTVSLWGFEPWFQRKK